MTDQEIPVGTLALNYNAWTGHNCPEIHEPFTALSEEDLGKLSVDDTFWLNDDHLHANEKVDGYCKVQVTGVSREGEIYLVSYMSPARAGSKPVYASERHGMYRADEDVLAKLLEKHPKATMIDPD